MYKNYGDVNFLNHGGYLVDADGFMQKEDKYIYVISCFYYDEKHMQIAFCRVNPHESWFSELELRVFCQEEKMPWNPVNAAIAAVSYYGIDKFRDMERSIDYTKEEDCKILQELNIDPKGFQLK